MRPKVLDGVLEAAAQRTQFRTEARVVLRFLVELGASNVLAQRESRTRADIMDGVLVAAATRTRFRTEARVMLRFPV